ncbi:GD16258 [Drosophila simulans]|uniref:GD16258 n=1 Tax=Drosophila simulans TaxID=7240 RepID=B4R4Z1_DROSI|nr:GD16258 [Drosophila simulans]
MPSQQLTLIFGMALLWALASGTTQPPSRRPPVTTARTTPRNCPLFPQVCSKTSPRVCGRTPRGECQRFENICHLMLGQCAPAARGRDTNPRHRLPQCEGNWCRQSTTLLQSLSRPSRRLQEIAAQPAHLRAEQGQPAVQGAVQQLPAAQPELPQPAQEQ